MPAPAHVARRLRLPDGDQLVTRTRYLMSADGSPVQLATSYEPAATTAQTPVPFPEQGTFAGRGVVERMQAIGIGVDQVVEEISVRPALSAEAAVLNIPAGSPVLLIERSHRSGERTVETGEIVIAADRFRLRYRFPVPVLADPVLADPVLADPGAGRPGGRRVIRPAEAADIPAIHRLIRDLAEYEKALAEVSATEEDLRRALLGERPAVFAHVAEARR